MLTLDMAARDELVEMHNSYGLREPVVVFGMAAKIVDEDSSLVGAFSSGDNDLLLDVFKRRYDEKLVFSFAVTLHERSDLVGDDVVAIDEFYFEIPGIIKNIVDGSCLCFEKNAFFLRDYEGKCLGLPIA